MLAVVVFGLSVIACRNFALYYWRALSSAQGTSRSAETAAGEW